MTTPPLPPRPYGAYNGQDYNQHGHGRQPSLPPPIPPLPTQYRPPPEDYYSADTVLTPHLTEPLVAPRPQKVLSDVPSNMARRLDDQLSSPPPPSFPQPSPTPYLQSPPSGPQYMAQPAFPASRSPQPGWMNSTSPRPLARSPGPGAFPTPPLEQTQSFGAAGTYGLGISMQGMSLNEPQLNNTRPTSQYTLPPMDPEPRRSSPRKNAQGLPELTAVLPSIQVVLENRNQTDPQYQVRWAKDVFWLVDKAQQVGGSAPPPGPARLSDPQLQSLGEQASSQIMRIAPQLPIQSVPGHVAEALYLKGKLLTSGAFPDQCPPNPREAFRCFEASARAGYAPGWFQLGRDYETVNDFHRARDCFDRGARARVESCYYRLGMANLLGQLNIPVDMQKAIPLLRNAAFNASVDVPQPAYVYGLLLLGEFPNVTVPSHLFNPFLPQGTNIQTEARKHIERAAYLGFSPAQYKMGHAYEFASPPFPFDPLLSVQYYSLASQQGEDEADMALSKWFLCGAEGAFDKDENLACTFAEKAAKKGLATAQFALGYYAEVGVGRPNDPEIARKWYQKAAIQGNTDAQERLNALSQPTPKVLSREEHENLTDAKLVRRRTQAKISSDAAGRAARRTDDQETQRVVGVVRKTSLLHKPNRREATEGGYQLQDSPNPNPNPNPGPPGPTSYRPGLPSGPLAAQRGHGRFGSGPRLNRRVGSETAIPPPQQYQVPNAPSQQYQAPNAPPQQYQAPNARPPPPQMVNSTPPIQPVPPVPEARYSAPAPDKGPATFQEMGIATGKVEEKDCVIM